MRLAGVGLVGLCALGVVVSLTAQGPAVPEGHPPVAPQQNRAKANALTEQVRPSEDGPRASTAPVARKNFIDEYIFSKMEKDGIPHAALSSDEEFMRRIYIDLTGRTPKDDELRAFLADKAADKRDKLIDKLAASRPYEARWTYFYGDLYKNAYNRIGNDGKNVFHKWIYDNIHLDRSYKAMVEEMLAANAVSNWNYGPAGYVARWVVIGANCDEEIHEDTSDEEAIMSVRHFLGIDMSCVSCHDGKNHLEKINLWLTQRKREETWKMAAFFAKTRVLRRTEISTAQDEYSIDDEGPGYDPSAQSVVRVPRNGKKGVLEPAFVMNGKVPNSDFPLRPQYAKNLTDDPQFARHNVNLLWAEMFGVGIVDPPFDFDLMRQDPKNVPAGWSVQPSHPELLEALAKYFRENNYSIKSVVKLIAKSNAYQLSSKFNGEWKGNYAQYFARKFVRRMKAEEIHDSLVTATNLFTPVRIPGTDLTKNFAMELFDPEDAQRVREGAVGEMHFFLEAFGQTNREWSERSNEGDITQAVLLMNSPYVLRQIKAAPNSYLEGLLKEQVSDDDKVTRLFQRFLVRQPSREEVAKAKDIAKSSAKGWEDLQWLLINKVEFVHNY